MVCRHSALLGLLSALGALGRTFKSYRPDSKKPSHTSELPRLAFYWKNLSTPKVDKILFKYIHKKSYSLKLMLLNSKKN